MLIDDTPYSFKVKFMSKDKIILALPKGRILKELTPILKMCAIVPEDDFFDKDTRKIRFTTNHAYLDIICVRSFDAATFVAYGGAHLGVAGGDVLSEHTYDDIYAPLDLGIGQCRLCVAIPTGAQINFESLSHIHVATKYPHITARYFAAKGIQAECIKLNGAMEIAPALGLSKIIVDLVSSGATLKANGLKDVATIMEVSSKLIVNRTAFKTRRDILGPLIEQLTKATYTLKTS
jgi:ATP phosphoribosyltransferase